MRARESVYWPRISIDIKEVVAKCSTCQEHQKRQQSEPLLPQDVPQYPWQKLGTDIFDFNQEHYLIVVDYYSWFPVIQKLGSSMTAELVVGHTKSIVIIIIIISDNGPQYNSALYKEFCTKYGIKHVTSSPRYPQSIGEAERAIQTTKKLLLKALTEMALLNYRATPLAHNLPSPAELLMGRKSKTLMPSRRKVLKPNLDHDDVKSRFQARQASKKENHDKRSSSTPLCSLQPGDSVRMYNDINNKWEPGVVVTQDTNPRSYIVKTPKGNYRRNRKFLHDSR